MTSLLTVPDDEDDEEKMTSVNINVIFVSLMSLLFASSISTQEIINNPLLLQTVRLLCVSFVSLTVEVVSKVAAIAVLGKKEMKR